MAITLIGTSHIAKESIRKVTRAIEEQKPAIVAVELDARRYYALTHNIKKPKFSFYNITRVGLKGFIFAAIGSWASNKLGRMVGVEPGDEMKTAIKLAKKHKLQLALVDRDIEITLNRFSMYLTWKERWRFVADILKGLVFGKREMKKYGIEQFDLSKVPGDEIIKKMMKMMKDRYPSVYKVLVHERNVYMAQKLQQLQISSPKADIVAVVGAGHVEGIMEIMAEPAVTFSYTLDADSIAEEL